MEVVPDQKKAHFPLTGYQSYVPGVLALLEKGAGVDVVGEHLKRLASAQMGLELEHQKPWVAAYQNCIKSLSN